MGDDRHQKIRQRAYEIWEREGRLQGDQDRHWYTAAQEIDREEQLQGQALTEPSAVGATVLSSRAKKPKRGEISNPDVLTAEAVAMRTGITRDQAQDLIDRLGNDRAAIEEAARSLATGLQNFSK